MKRIDLDYAKRCRDEPAKGHNRWHPDITAAVTADPGEEVVLQTRNAFDGEVTPSSRAGDLSNLNLNVVHPLTGPVFVNGAEPGDLLEVNILQIEPAAWGFTTIIPGFGFLRDVFLEPYIVHWIIEDGYAESPDLPGVRIPGAPFMGTIGVAPSRELLREIFLREDELLQRGGAVLGPEPNDAVPAQEPIASEALRTIPPREHGGNLDIKPLTAGTRLLLPVFTPGALFSAGDAHFAQGDSECCGTAVEMDCTLHVNFQVRKGEAARLAVSHLRTGRLFHHAGDGRAAPIHSIYRHVHRQRSQRIGERYPGVSKRSTDHDPTAHGAGLVPRASVLHL